jgi:hypothetical protein
MLKLGRFCAAFGQMVRRFFSKPIGLTPQNRAVTGQFQTSVVETTRHSAFTLPAWSAAEFLDVPYADGLRLRAVICRLGPGEWQVTLISMSGDSGEVISVSVARTAAEAREVAASELDKSMRDPFA